jgi:hypothetical protein
MGKRQTSPVDMQGCRAKNGLPKLDHSKGSYHSATSVVASKRPNGRKRSLHSSSSTMERIQRCRRQANQTRQNPHSTDLFYTCIQIYPRLPIPPDGDKSSALSLPATFCLTVPSIPLISEKTTYVPPSIAHNDVTNSYQRRPACEITTAVGDKSYVNLASGTFGSALNWWLDVASYVPQKVSHKRVRYEMMNS